MRPIWKMYWNNGCKKTVERMRKEQTSKPMDLETIKKINSRIGETAKATDNGTMNEAPELKDWQWEIMLENESKDENRE